MPRGVSGRCVVALETAVRAGDKRSCSNGHSWGGRRTVVLETARSAQETGIRAGLRVLRVSYVVIYRREGE